ncbi:MAG: hypothetical protein ACKVXR_04730 [Planctomycetota bacterium]
MKSAVLVTLSENKHWITHDVTDLLRREGATLVQSYTTKLGSLYGEQFQFEAREVDLEHIRVAVTTELPRDWNIILRECEPAPATPKENVHKLTIYAFDQPGVVQQVTRAVSSSDIDILGMAGCQYPAPHVGGHLFVLEITLDVPRGSAARALRSAMATIVDANGWDFDLEAMDSSDAQSASLPFPPSRATAEHSLQLIPGGLHRSSRQQVAG